MPAVTIEVPAFSYIPSFAPFGVLYYAQDTGNVYIGTGSSQPPYAQLVSSGGGSPGGFNGDIQFNNAGVFAGSAATIDANGNITLPNSTAATVSTTNASPTLALAANYWTGAASAQDLWTIGFSLAAGANGASTLTFTHSGSSGTALVNVLGNVQATKFLAGANSATSGGYNLAYGGAIWIRNQANTNDFRMLTFNTATVANQLIFGSGGGSGPAAMSFNCGLQALYINNSVLNMGSGIVLGWNVSTDATGTNDGGFSRLGAASVAFGNGTAADTSGAITAAQFKASANGSGTALPFGINGNNGIFADAQGNLRFCASSNASTYVTSAGFFVAGFNSPLGFASSNGVADGAFSRLGAASVALGNGTAGDFTGSLKLSGINLNGSSSGVGNIQFNSAASASFDTNLLYLTSTAQTGGFLFGSTPAFNTTNGGFCFGRGNTFSAFSNQRGLLAIGAGAVSAPVAPFEGAILFYAGTSNNTLALTIQPSGVLCFGAVVDTGVSRLAAGSFAIGNGAAGDTTGALSLASIALLAGSGNVAPIANNNGGGAISIGGRINGVTTNPNVAFIAGSNLNATSGTQYHASAQVTFAPTSGTANFVGLISNPTINQTGGANGTIRILAAYPVNTALVGTEYLLALGTSSASGPSGVLTDRFTVDNLGNTVLASATLTAAAPTVAASQVGLGSTTATTATAGANGAVPAQVAGYLIINVAGTTFKVPYFAN